MKILRPYFVALAAAALSSCGRSYYSFESKTSAYAGSVPTAVEPITPAIIPTPAAFESATVVAAVAQTSPVAHAAIERNAALTTLSAAIAPVAVPSGVAAAPTKVVKSSLVQRLALRSVLKRAAKTTAQQQNTAELTRTAATKGSITVALIGLIALVVGLIASSSFLITIGIILIVIGVILFLLKLL